MTIAELTHYAKNLPVTARMPVLFVGHGSPMNGIEDTIYTKKWEELGKILSRPIAILVVSAHWQTSGTMVHVAKHPKTIHDFFGFPDALYKISYDCDGAEDIARGVRNELGHEHVGLDTKWGIDHGAWIPLMHMYPKADVPVFQMSISAPATNQEHYDLGRALAPLRERGILIIGSGNIVHNLGKISWENNAPPFPWASTFDARIASLIVEHKHHALIDASTLGTEAILSIPTPEHYTPLLYTLGASTEEEPITFPVLGIAHGSISMRTVQIGK